MQRSVGVTISAIVILLGSLLALAVGMLAVVGLVSPRPNFPNYPKGANGFLIPPVFLLPAVWGITTSIGLFRLRNWGRISIIIFAALLPFFAPAFWVFAPLLLGVAIWWLVFFNLAHVKAQFMPRRR